MSIAHQIATVKKGSVADYAGIQPKDVIKALNGVELVDIFDYYYYADEAFLEILIEKPDHTQRTLLIEKAEGEDLGITFENGLMDDYKSCHNKCMFCFIDQMPPGMRETLYFKDDDTRLSFLQGNYVTLTNIKDTDLQRIIQYHLAPINISVHATNPALRCKMLNNRFAGDILDKIKRLADAEIEMNAQIVLCKGENDGVELERTIQDLLHFYPYMQSLSVVPVGLTKYREGLYPLKPFEKEDAQEVLQLIHKWQDYSYELYGTHFVQASDEWYLVAQQEIPTEERYDGYMQLENGVGMIRLLMDEFHESLKKQRRHLFMRNKKISIATGRLAAPFIDELCHEFMDKFPKIQIQVFPIRNDFFGHHITVSGLITGKDLIAQLQGKDLGECLFIPQNMVRCQEQDFLDDVKVSQVESALQVKIDIVKSSGHEFVKQLLM